MNANPTSGGMPLRMRREKQAAPKHAAPKAHRLDTRALIGIILLLVVGLIALFSASYPAAISKFNDGTFFVRRQGLYVLARLCRHAGHLGDRLSCLSALSKTAVYLCIALLILGTAGRCRSQRREALDRAARSGRVPAVRADEGRGHHFVLRTTPCATATVYARFAATCRFSVRWR